MKTRNFAPIGSLHPVLFFAGLYLVALLFFIFICSTIFYSCNASSTGNASPPNSLTAAAVPTAEMAALP